MSTYAGSVKMWNEEKGFGFLKVGGMKDVFCHISALKNSNFQGDPEVGDQVEFEIEQGERGARAINVVRV